ncbi:MAG: transposase [Chloroflexi bacterium]|nr:transposase [Chloroflexota bacterium]
MLYLHLRVMRVLSSPPFVFNQFGDCEGAMLRPGNVRSAHNWREVLEPIIIRHKRAVVRLYFRGDAAFASPEIYEYLEEHGSLYAIRLPSNEVLDLPLQHLMKRPVCLPRHRRRLFLISTARGDHAVSKPQEPKSDGEGIDPNARTSFHFVLLWA